MELNCQLKKPTLNRITFYRVQLMHYRKQSIKTPVDALSMNQVTSIYINNKAYEL